MLSTVRRLISEGVPSGLCNKVGWTPLHAAANGGADRVLGLLLERGVDVDVRCLGARLWLGGVLGLCILTVLSNIESVVVV